MNERSSQLLATCATVIVIVLVLQLLAPGQTSAAVAAATPHSQLSQAPATTDALVLTLQDALQRARTYSPEFRAALTDQLIAHEDKVQARAALLPNVIYNNQYLYTEGNGLPSGRFIANNAVHEYLSQGNAHFAFNLLGGGIADYRRAGALEALARAKAEIAARGLVVTVAQNFFGLASAQRKYAIAQRAATEARRFRDMTRQLETGGEVAHSDVIKAELQLNDRTRDLQEATLTMEKARLALAVIIFPNFNQQFSVVDDIRFPEPLPPLTEMQTMAGKNNPALRAAVATLQAASQEVLSSRAAHLPTLALDYFYGIDASHLAVHQPVEFGPGRFGIVRNLGYQANATLTVPIWNWGATQSKVRQAELRRTQASVELTYAQRKTMADLFGAYDEASIARSELEKLQNSVDLAGQSLRLVTLRYQTGEATVLEVVDAQNSLTAAQNLYEDGAVRYRLDIAQLQTITGPF